MMGLSRAKIAGNSRGFTLIELMIVVALIGILTATAFPLYTNILARARIAKAQADLRTLGSAAAVYAAQAGMFPASLNNLTVSSTVNGKAIPVYMKALPTPPVNWTTYTYTTFTGGTFRITTSSVKDGKSIIAP